jgi:dihydroxy-acid dehydratase
MCRSSRPDAIGRFRWRIFYAGGIPAVMKEIADLLDLDALTVTGKSVRENIANAQNSNSEVIRPREKALTKQGGIVVLRGNLALVARS